jgi:PAS domain S-box-containing protein
LAKGSDGNMKRAAGTAAPRSKRRTALHRPSRSARTASAVPPSASDTALRAALDLLPIGIGIFSKKLRLVYANRPFGALRDLPQALCEPGTLLSEILRYNADRGDFGPGDPKQQTADRMAEIASLRPREVERELFHGRRLLIRYTPIRGSGIMLSYTDVTDAKRTEQALGDSEERHALVTQAVAEGIYEWDIKRNTLWISARLIEMFGLRDRELTAADWNALVHSDDFANYRVALRECLRGNATRVDCEYRVRHSDGQYRWIKDRGIPVRDAAGRAIRLVGALDDVTEQKAVEQALRESEERYALAMRSTREGVYEWDVAAGKIYYSPGVTELVGLTSEQLQTVTDWTERIHPDDLPGYRAAILAHLKRETDRLDHEYRYRHSDGTWHWARQHGIALRDEAGRAYRVVGSTGDITKERELARELLRARGRFHDAIEALDEGIALFDPDDRLVICNSRYARFFRDLAGTEIRAGMTFESFMRAGLERGMFPLARGDPETWLKTLLAHRREGRAREQYLASGTWLRVRDYTTDDGSLVSVYTDVTDLKQRQQELERAREQAEHALDRLRATQQQLIVQQKMASLGQLTAGIAHEIKNPLNFVNNFAGLSGELLDEFKAAAAPALATLEPDKRAEIDETIGTLAGNLQKIAEHGRRADGIVKSMLLHSRGSSGERQSVDLNALVEEALNLAYHGARAQDQNFDITLEREFDPTLAPIELIPQDVTRVFLNLISNGLYAVQKRDRSNGGHPALKVVTRDLGAVVEVRVRDNGTGIAPENRDKLFQPFFTTKPTGEGTGLGLSISYEIVTQQHGGTIEVESEVGAFTEITVRLPRDRRFI